MIAPRIPAVESLSAGRSLLVLGGFVLLLTLGATHHEMWRDEVRAWSIATAGPSFLSIFRNIHNEGHPALWYVLLRASSALTAGSRLALPLTSAAVAVAAVWVFIRYAPFPAWVRVLFPFGYFPVYEYSVMSRNYGISMLLMFVICAVWRRRWELPLALGALLALLAQTNAHSSILVGALMLAWGGDALQARKGWRDGQQVARLMGLAAGLALACAGLMVCAITVKPDATTYATGIVAATPGALLRAAVFGFAKPGVLLHSGFFPLPGFEFSAALDWATGLALLLVGWILRDRPALLVAYVAAVGGFLGLFAVVYPGEARHQGLLFVFVLALFWIAQLTPPKDDSADIDGVRSAPMKLLLLGLLFFHAASGTRALANDVRREKSDAPALAEFVKSHPVYQRAVIMGEPDYLLETLPYYLGNPLFVAREGKFERWTNFTTANADTLTLAQLLDSAEAIRLRTGRPVLVYFGKRNLLAEPKGRFTVFRGSRWFSWTPSQRQRLLASTEYMGYLGNSSGDEHYRLFALPGSAVARSYAGSQVTSPLHHSEPGPTGWPRSHQFNLAVAEGRRAALVHQYHSCV